MGFLPSRKKAVEKCWLWDKGIEREVSVEFIRANRPQLTYDGWFRDCEDIVNHYYIRYG